LVTPGDSIFVNHAEGRAAYRLYDENGNYLPGWYYEYTLRDHPGNGRVYISDKNGDGFIQVGRG
jgi:hypothetical protein